MNDKKYYSQRKCNTSPLILSLISLSLFGAVLFTKDVTFIAQITLRWPEIQLLGREKSVHQEIKNPISPDEIKINHEINHDQTLEEEIDDDNDDGIELPPKWCDLSKGKWVFDNVTRPIYKEEKCEFLTAQVTCGVNGRDDTLYQNWRWQPNDCSLPKFKVKLMLEKLRGKRLMFVGDSVNRNQWESMICLLNTAIAPGRATWTVGAPLSVFFIQDYNATVEFYWAPFLVESNSDDPRNHSISQRILMPESISKHGAHWKSADFLVFNTYIWWMNNHTIKVLRGSFDQGSIEYDEVERSTAYERVMTTWADWLKNNVNHSLTASFFISMSPVHWQSSNWNNPDGLACARESTPILNTTMELDMGTDRRLLDVVRNAIKMKEVPVNLIDITTLSEYRKDAHTSVYTLRQGKLLTPEQKADPATFADCLHWCLPGVPDTWNELLYTHIISRS
ncbi:trichome birefringence-like protein [Perilla frutescens var. hirtella]|uniref:Trichome birefringence-like protein n=1 Tax=Perilla frutescens var. hirtella TaxID=608512 RepID=A0AAD4JR30_PERFH|nr:trichome birefringence-like protein [Perilla frutescens var. hirtella]